MIGIATPKPAARFVIIKASTIYSSAFNFHLSLVRICALCDGLFSSAFSYLADLAVTEKAVAVRYA